MSRCKTPVRLGALALVLGLALGQPTAAFAQSDPFVGTWVLSLAKSKFSPGPAPKTQTAIYAVAGAGLSVTATGTGGDGKPIATSYSAHFDGKDYPVTGSSDYDMTSWKRVNSHTISLTRKKAGKVVQTGRIVVSKDGKTRTVTVNGTNAKGQKIHNVSVYEKQ